MRTLVTGGAGFIGSHLAEALASAGHSVVVLDDLSSGKRENLRGIPADRNVQVVVADAGDPNVLRSILPGIQWIFHLAALPSVPASIENPIESNDRNLTLTLRLLQAARDASVERLIFASSSSIYGNSQESPKHEGLPPNPRSPYALQKYAAERYAALFAELYNVPTVSLRYFNVFGPRQSHSSPYSGVIARFARQIFHNERPTIFGDGTQSRDFVYVDNVVHANLLVAQAPADRVVGRFFNVGGDDSISLLQLTAELNKLLGKNLSPIFAAERPGDVRSSHAAIDALRAATGYNPIVPWREGLRRTVNWLVEHPA